MGDDRRFAPRDGRGRGRCSQFARTMAKLRLDHTNASTPMLVLAPLVKDVGLTFLIPSSIRSLDFGEAILFVEAPGDDVALEGPEPQPCLVDLRLVQKAMAQTKSLMIRRDVELIDPAVANRHKANQLGFLKTAPDFAGGKNGLAIEVSVFFWSVQASKPRHAMIERRPVNSGGCECINGCQASDRDHIRALQPEFGGRRGIRTPDPLGVNEVL
jgi:hypothetical protein